MLYLQTPQLPCPLVTTYPALCLQAPQLPCALVTTYPALCSQAGTGLGQCHSVIDTYYTGGAAPPAKATGVGNVCEEHTEATCPTALLAGTPSCAFDAYTKQCRSTTAEVACSAYSASICPSVHFLEFEATPKGVEQDAVCLPVAVCGADEFIGTAATATSDHVCMPRTVCASDEWACHVPTAPDQDRKCCPITTCTPLQYQLSTPVTTHTCTTPTDASTCSSPADRVCSTARVCTSNEFETVALTRTSDRECEAIAPPCTYDTYRSPYRDANEYQAVAPGPSSDRVCHALTDCDWATEYEAPADVSTRITGGITWRDADRVCTAKTVCGAGKYAEDEGDQDTDRTCSPITTCSEGEFEVRALDQFNGINRACQALRVCTPLLEFEITQPTPTSDRRCMRIDSHCIVGEQFEFVSPSATANRRCMPITDCGTMGSTEDGAFGPPVPSNGTVETEYADPQAKYYETRPPTATTDRACARVARRDCGNSKVFGRNANGTEFFLRYETPLTRFESAPPTEASNRVCREATTCTAEQFEDAPPTFTTDRVCQAITLCSEDEYEVTPTSTKSDRVYATFRLPLGHPFHHPIRPPGYHAPWLPCFLVAAAPRLPCPLGTTAPEDPPCHAP